MAAAKGNLPMSRLMLQSDLVAAMSHESQRDLRALTDANDKVPSDIARSMGADATLIQVSLALSKPLLMPKHHRSCAL